MAAARGWALAEALVALGVLLALFVAALGLYERSRHVFQRGADAIEQQQGLRVALDAIATDLRAAGLDGNPEPDEPIEAALDTAVVLRADRDAEHDAEILGYALGGPGARSQLVFWGDVAGGVRDGRVEPVVVRRVALAPDAPPYTLYRVTLDEGGVPVKTPVADNVSALRLRYFDRAGAEVAPPGGGESEAERLARGAIRRIAVELEVQSRDPERRRLLFRVEVAPRNLGVEAGS